MPQFVPLLLPLFCPLSLALALKSCPATLFPFPHLVSSRTPQKWLLLLETLTPFSPLGGGSCTPRGQWGREVGRPNWWLPTILSINMLYFYSSLLPVAVETRGKFCSRELRKLNPNKCTYISPRQGEQWMNSEWLFSPSCSLFSSRLLDLSDNPKAGRWETI